MNIRANGDDKEPELLFDTIRLGITIGRYDMPIGRRRAGSLYIPQQKLTRNTCMIAGKSLSLPDKVTSTYQCVNHYIE